MISIEAMVQPQVLLLRKRAQKLLLQQIEDLLLLYRLVVGEEPSVKTLIVLAARALTVLVLLVFRPLIIVSARLGIFAHLQSVTRAFLMVTYDFLALRVLVAASPFTF